MGKAVFIHPRARLVTILATTALLIAIPLTSVQADNSTGPWQPSHPDKSSDTQREIINHVPGQLVVKFISDTVSSGVFGDRISGFVSDYLEASGVYLYEVDSDADTYRLTDSVMEMSSVAYAHPNYIVNALHPVQGSYPFSDGIGSGSYEGQPAVSTLGLASAHEIATGAGATAAVIDGGIDYTHLALSGAALSGYDFVDSDNEAFDEPGGYNSGHGTFVAGIIHLVAPDATIKAYRVTDADGTGDGFTLAKAIEEAVMDGCDVINLSVVLMHEHLAVRDAVAFALSQNVAVIAAAGNEGSAMFTYPAANNGVIAVAAVDSVNRLADFSNYGAFIDVCAPGTNVYSAYQNDGYAWWSGTSFATPFVTGQMMLLKEKFPSFSVAILGDAIKGAATDIDVVNPAHVGDLGGGLVNPMAAFDALQSSDTAAIIPDSLFFTISGWDGSPISPFQTAVITSTNAPADFVGVAIDTDYIPITTTDSISGVTNDSVTLFLNDACYGYPPGTYYNHFMFEVVGVPKQVMLVVSLAVQDTIHSGEQAYINPAWLNFQAPVGAEPALSGLVWLTSSNAPADYSAWVQPGGAGVTSLVDSSGVTPDTMTVVVDPALADTPGFYYDTVAIEVDGVDDPLYLPVRLELTDTSGVDDTAWVLQDSLQSFVIEEGSDVTFQDAILVFSTNAPANYYLTYSGVLKFTTVTSSDGVTNGSTHFEVHAPYLFAGVYEDTLLFYVDRVSNNPVEAVITLEVDSLSGPPVDYAYVWPQTHCFAAPLGEETAQFGGVFISSTNAPAAFAISVFDEADFVSLVDSTGTTDDSASFDVLSTGAMPSGTYCDTLAINVEGCDNNPLYSVVYLTIDTTINPGQETATVDPDVLSLYAYYGAPVTYRNVWLTSTNAPADYVGVVMGGASSFVELPDTTGTTDDSVTIAVDPSGLEEGTYSDSVIFFVDSVDNPAHVIVNLTVVPLPDSVITLRNYPNPFNPGTNIALSLHRASHVKLDVFNILGRHVVTLLDGPMTAGEHTVYWEGTDSNGRAVASGTYFYRLHTDEQTLTRKMVLLK